MCTSLRNPKPLHRQIVQDWHDHGVWYRSDPKQQTSDNEGVFAANLPCFVAIFHDRVFFASSCIALTVRQLHVVARSLTASQFMAG
jgi:hypothetical protein